MMDCETIRARLAASFPDAQIEVVSDDNVHFAARVVSAAFAGKSRVAQHQMVYRAVGPELGHEIHALTLITLTPEEWQVQQRGG
jgi:stress-induced morphogen